MTCTIFFHLRRGDMHLCPPPLATPLPVIVYTLSFLLLNLVTITSDPKDIHMHCPDVTLRSIRSHLSHVASLSIYNVFKIIFLCSFYHCMCVYTFPFPLWHVRLLRVLLNINQSINQYLRGYITCYAYSYWKEAFDEVSSGMEQHWFCEKPNS